MSSSIFLYIKQHQITRLKYFGKTIKDSEKYKGSGTYWRRHLKQHGKNIDTLCVWEFDNQEECTEFALKFSKENDIVASHEWANLGEETGLDGPPKGYTKSIETKLKTAKTRKGIKFSEQARKNMSKAQKGKKLTEEHKLKIKLNNGKKGKKIIFSQEHRNNISKANSGELSYWHGKKHSPESKEKMRLAKLGNTNALKQK